MLYETTYMPYVFHVNYGIWCNVSQYTKEEALDGLGHKLRENYVRARHCDVLRDNRLIVPLEDFGAYWDKNFRVL